MPAPLSRTAASTVVVGLTLTCAIACAAVARPASDIAPPPSSAQAITAREIAAAASSTTAYEAIERLRPLWLSARRTAERPVVYVDNIEFGDFEELYRISPADIEEIRLFRGYDATTRWGTGHTAGVILVITKR